MVLLDQNISKIEVAESKGTGQVNEELLMILRTGRLSESSSKPSLLPSSKKMWHIADGIPDFDILVGYEGDSLPTTPFIYIATGGK